MVALSAVTHTPERTNKLPDNRNTRAASVVSNPLAGEENAWETPSFTLPPEPVPLGHALHRVMRAVIFENKPLPELDALPLAQMRLLWAVFYGAQATMKDYSERLGVSQSTVTQLAERLVRRGLIERLSDPEDRRVVRLHVSQAGSQIMRTAKDQEHQTLQAIWQAITPEEQQAIMRGLELLGGAAESLRAAQGRPLAPFFGPHQQPALTEPDTGGQPVVDLMTRRVRGK